MSLPLSVLDLIPVVSGSTSHEALANSVALATCVDRLGYTRLWYAEHHNMPGIASTTPDLAIARVGDRTTRIRLGSGGVMLPNHAPLVVAERYKMLEAMFPGRIDLGLGRAPGTDPATAQALRRSRDSFAPDDFPQQLAQLVAFAEGNFPAQHPFRSVSATPADVALPPVWLLGSSDYSALLAAQLGLGYAFAAHFSPDPPELPMVAYRANFRPGPLARPHAILCVSVVVADTDEEAERLASTMQLAFVRIRNGERGRLPSPEEALAYAYSPAERAVAQAYRALQIVGRPDAVRDQLTAIARRTQADELMITSMIHDQAARLHSFERLAVAWGLVAAATQPA